MRDEKKLKSGRVYFVWQIRELVGGVLMAPMFS
jgi:hypothetical protein